MSSHAMTIPGTVSAEYSPLFGISFIPLSVKNCGVSAENALPLPFRSTIFPLESLRSANMSPPSPHRLFCVTQSTELVAIAASNTLPPRSSTLAPASDENMLEEETTARSEKALGLVLTFCHFEFAYNLALE